MKNVSSVEFPRRDNSDKKSLFREGRKPRTAEEHREEWGFIKDDTLLDNISYQMQYLEFQILLYNEYQMYLTLESLHFKNIIGTIGGIIESALSDLVWQRREKARGRVQGEPTFMDLIDEAYKLKVIGQGLRKQFHVLRKERNLMHFSDIAYQEYSAYTIGQANAHIEALLTFIDMEAVG